MAALCGGVMRGYVKANVLLFARSVFDRVATSLVKCRCATCNRLLVSELKLARIELS